MATTTEITLKGRTYTATATTKNAAARKAAAQKETT